jgi:hypothetical protein
MQVRALAGVVERERADGVAVGYYWEATAEGDGVRFYLMVRRESAIDGDPPYWDEVREWDGRERYFGMVAPDGTVAWGER